jgi:putative peptidoglycan lipid II flippase
MSAGRIARSTGTVAAATGVSRALGFVRDLLLAGLFGTGLQAQAFVVAFRLPNLLRDLVGEGAVTSAFVPVLSSYRARGHTEAFWRMSQALLSRLVVVLCAISVLGVLAAPIVVRLVAPGFIGDPDAFALTVRLTRLLFPLITLVGLWAYFMGLLNSLHHFTAPALGPALLNLAMIVACLWFVPVTSPGVLAVAIGVLIGGALQLAIQVPVAVRLGFRWRWRWAHPGASQTLRLLGPRTVGSAVYQANVLIHTALATLAAVVGQGAVAALYFANRLVQLPLALFGTASAQASLPSLAEQAARGDHDAFGSTVLAVLRMIGFIMVPSAVGLAVLAVPIVQTLFERGAFDHRSTMMTAQALACYALGLWAYAVSKVLTGAFYALHDTWTPVRLASEAMAVNVVLSLALMWPLKVSGLALAAALATTLNAVRLLRSLERRLKRPLLAPLRQPLARVMRASALMGAGCWVLWAAVGPLGSPWGALALIIAASLILYAAACRLMGVQELTQVTRWFGELRRLSPSASE